MALLRLRLQELRMKHGQWTPANGDGDGDGDGVPPAAACAAPPAAARPPAAIGGALRAATGPLTKGWGSGAARCLR